MKKKTEFSYLQCFRPFIWRIIIAFLLSAAATVGSFVTTHVLSRIVDKLPSIMTDVMSVLFLIAVWLVVDCTAKLANYVSSKFILHVKVQSIQKLRYVLAKTLESSSSESVRKNSPTSLVESANEDAKIFVDAIHSIYIEVFTVLLGIAALIYTAVHSWQIFLLLFISFVIIILLQYFMVKKMVMAQIDARKASIDTKNLFLQIVEAFSDMKVQGLAKGLKPLLSNKFDTETRENIKAQKIMLNNSLTSELISSFSQASFLLLAGYLILTSNLSFATFVALFMYKGFVYGLVGSIIRIVKFKAQADTATRRMNSILNYEVVSKEIWGTTTLPTPSGSISIKDLKVNYRESCVINGLSVEIPCNSFVGIVGNSGCGKSTLCKVLSKEVSEYSGSILLDGIELNSLDEWSHRRAIAMAPQTPFLFNFSIKKNLLLAHPKASDDEIWNCLEQCAAAQFVREKGGLDTVLTPDQLSGGQKQRLALARLAICGGKIILLDESTSALDGESQELVLKTFRKAADMGHTMVLVAHRVSTLKNADIIIVMEDGKVSATGTYDELYNTSEKFRKLAELG